MENEIKKRVGLVMPLGQQRGGAEALLMNLLRHRSDQHHFVCAFLEDGPLVSKVKSIGYSARVFPTTRLTDPFNYLATIKNLSRWIAEEKLATVFSWMPKAHLYAGPAAYLRGARAIWFHHGITWGTRIDRIITRIPTAGILCCSNAGKEAQDKLKPARRTEVCYPGVTFPSDTPMDKAEARSQLGLATDIPIVGMVARWERWKGAHIFIQAADRLAFTRPSAHFFIVGGPHPRDLAYAEELRGLAAHSPLGDRLLLVGQLPPEQVPVWQAAADVIVHPVTSEEPFGMAVVEAMGMGKVVIASNAGGPAEIIHSGEDGLLVPRRDSAALAVAIDEMLDSPVRRNAIQERAFLRGRSFSVSVFVHRVDELITLLTTT
ncbi:glycosyltransferase family 4 protein [Tunturiibacter lichenicola]|uniref:glycosyltransferase family 4 protein n=1 Tax=Tunturiibacter lichenicola TaxID=2051959 RepID=UPI003D9BFDE9